MASEVIAGGAAVGAAGERDEGGAGGGAGERDEGGAGGGAGERDEGGAGGGAGERDEGGAGGGAGERDEGGAGGGAGEGGAVLTAAQRARMERQRQRARALHDARRVQLGAEAGREAAAARARDTGGGFLLEDVAPAPRAPAHPPAPLVHRSEQPHCLECERPFPQSYLFDTFDYSVCDECRDDEEAHALMTRTEAKSEYLLKDCDLDAREPALRCVRRRNPHRARYSDMRLYLRAQVAARALLVWGDEAALERERTERARRRDKAQETASRRRLRELRLAARSSLLSRRAAAHEHAWGAEQHDAAADCYSRSCATCGHTETYEKM